MRGRRAFWLVCAACVGLTACGGGPTGGFSTGGGPAPSPGVIQRLTVSSDGVQADRPTFSVSISGDGRFVVYASLADNLVPGDSNLVQDVFLRDTCQGAAPASCTPTTTLVSVSNFGAQANGFSAAPSISRDARFVAFESEATNLAAGGDTNNSRDIFVRDTCQGALPGCAPSTIRVSVANDGSQADGGSFEPSISADGRFVAFSSNATNLVPGDTNAAQDIFVRDTCQGAPAGCAPSTIRASVSTAGTQADLLSGAPSISDTGRFVAFTSGATNLVAGDTNNQNDVFVRDTCAGVSMGCTPSTIRASVGASGAEGNGLSSFASISGDGRFVAFQSSASNLVAGDTNGAMDVFVRDTCAGAAGCTPTTVRVDVGTGGAEANGASDAPSISTSGRFVSFRSAATNLVAGDTNALDDIFVRDTCLGVAGCIPSTTRVSVASDATQANANSFESAISGDGKFVAFRSFASNLVTGDTNGVEDIFLAHSGF